MRGESELQLISRWMRENHVAKYKDGVLEIELRDSAFGAAQSAVEAAPPDETCTCGHPLHDHNQSGCVLGCDLETCGRAEAE